MKNKKKIAKKKSNTNTQPMKMEALEPRILMSATQVQSDTWDQAFAEIQQIATQLSASDEFGATLPYVVDNDCYRGRMGVYSKGIRTELFT